MKNQDKRKGQLVNELAELRQRVAELEALAEHAQQLEAEVAQCKRAEAVLGEGEKRYRSLFENMLEGYAYCKMLFDHDEPQDFVYIAVNNTFEQLTGLKDVVGKKVSDIIPGIKESNPELFEVYGRVALTGMPERFETYVAPLRIWFSIAVYSPGKGYFTAVFDNITARKQAEQQRQVLIESLPDGVLVVNAEGHIVVANAQTEVLFGYRREELLGQPIEMLLPERLRALHPRHRAGYFAAPTNRTMGSGMELYARRKDGSEFPVDISLSAVETGQGRTAIAVVRDITERKQIEQKVAVHLAVQRVYNEILQMQSEADWEKVVLAFKEELGSLVKYNAAGVNILTHQDQSIVVHQGKPSEVLTPEVKFSPQFRQGVQAEAPMYRRNREEMARWGDTALLAMGVGAVVDVPFFTGTVAMNSMEEEAFSERDVQILGQFAPVMSEAQRRLEDLKILALTERQLHQSQKMEAIGQLAGGVAHDFNNLLTIITGYSQLLLRKGGVADLQEAHVGEIMNAAERGTTLVGQLLALSRKQVLQPEILDLNVVVSDLKKMLRPLIGEDVELLTHLTPDLGSVKADRGQVEQVLLNLVVNARDAMPKGGKLVIETHNAELDETYTLRHTVVKPGAYVLLSVSDTGVGMDMATQERIFEPFFTTKEPGKGTGLGLATIYGIIKQSGGYIWVYSEPGQGTAFKIYLPRLEETTPMATGKEAPPVTMRGVETVLLVEDEEALRQLVALLLREEGYIVLEASRGEEALKISAQHPGTIHLLVSDVVMPGMGGHELLKELKPLRPAVKVLYISGYSAQIVEHQGVFQPGMVFLQKPFKAEGLLLKVREALETTQPLEG